MTPEETEDEDREIKAFRKRLEPLSLQERSDEILIEIAIQLIRLNGGLGDAIEAIHATKS